jgi:signal transduction histidine kinase
LLFYMYLRLIVLTAGTLMPFIWIVVILGHRRQRQFERIFFFLCLALVFLFGGSLLALNAELYYATIPPKLTIFAWTLVCLGLWMLPSLVLHLHVEYAQVRELIHSVARKRMWLLTAYLPALLLVRRLYVALRAEEHSDFVFPSNALGRMFQVWLVFSLWMAGYWQRKFARASPDEEQKTFHRSLQRYFVLMTLLIFGVHAYIAHVGGRAPSDGGSAVYGTLLLLVAMQPLIGLIRNVQKFNFLQIGRQRNLMYAVFAAFIGLLYLSFIRRLSLWLDPYLPPEASAALLLFLPVAFFEPLQRFVGRLLRRTAQTEMDRAQRMMGPIHEVARFGDVGKLSAFVQSWIAAELQLADVKLLLDIEAGLQASGKATPELFPIRKAGQIVGALRVQPYGAMLSGETEVALEFLCEQLPGPLDLCRLIEEKLELERELAERERLAVLGQMAASISHNLKNPLGSIKTILQVQLESPELPKAIRSETKMVLEEIARLSGKLNQLLQFSRPVVRGASSTASCDPDAIAEQVAALLRHEAERRHVKLETGLAAVGRCVAASAESVNDIVTNLVVNALEAAHCGGVVRLSSSGDDRAVQIVVEDDGPGIAEAAREKIWQPFFTTKSQGTGLGLAIVARRIAECGAKVAWESPVKDGRGTRFCVALPIEKTEKQ